MVCFLMLVMCKMASADGDDHGALLPDGIMRECRIWLLCQAAKHRFGVGGSAVSDR